MTRLIIFIGLMLVVAACQQEAVVDGPPEILVGQDVCAECGMIIGDIRFAAIYMTTSGEVRRFDDIGNMLLYDQKNGEDVRAYWVHDFNTEHWIAAEQAVLVLNPQLPTPMGWGLAAFADQESAHKYKAEHGGTTTTFAALREGLHSGVIDPASLARHVHDHETHD